MPTNPPTLQFVGPIPIYPESGFYFEAAPDGQDYTLDIKSRYVTKYRGPFVNLYAAGLWGIYNRGVISGAWIINNSRLQKERGGMGTLTINWESIDNVPYDEWSVVPEDLQPRIERHPRYSSLVDADFKAIQNAYLASNNEDSDTQYNRLNGCGNPSLAQELYGKMLNGMETYYLAGCRYTWTSYYLPGSTVTLSEGGDTETPGGPGGYILPPNFSWLRFADETGLALYAPLGGIIKITRRWIGGPNGFWDSDIYPPG